MSLRDIVIAISVIIEVLFFIIIPIMTYIKARKKIIEEINRTHTKGECFCKDIKFIKKVHCVEKIYVYTFVYYLNNVEYVTYRKGTKSYKIKAGKYTEIWINNEICELNYIPKLDLLLDYKSNMKIFYSFFIGFVIFLIFGIILAVVSV